VPPTGSRGGRDGYQEADRGGEAKREEGGGDREAEADDREPAREHAPRAPGAAQRGRRRGGSAGRALEDRNRQQLYELAQKRNIPGRSKMGKWELIDALRKR
jgi:hypothetical protein